MGTVCLRSTSGWKAVGKSERLAEQVLSSSGKRRFMESHAWAQGRLLQGSGVLLQLLGKGCLLLAVLIQGSLERDLAHVLVA